MTFSPTETMNAWVVRAPGPIETGPLSYERKPVPRPGSGELLVRGNACGVCRTDLLVSEGDLLDKTRDAIRSLHFRRDRDWLQS